MYFYPRPPRGGRPRRGSRGRAPCHFYPRPPRGGRPISTGTPRRSNGFLSTPSARRATRGPGAHRRRKRISIHALREEGDESPAIQKFRLLNFYPRPPRGGRHRQKLERLTAEHISIHALREEGDPAPFPSMVVIYNDFYPRPPRGGRRWTKSNWPDLLRFLSTPSARRATKECPGQYRTQQISIHALREEGDKSDFTPATAEVYFYPRPPRGGRHQLPHHHPLDDRFLSTPSARRATAKTETKSLFSNKLYNILHEFRRALICNWSKNYPNHAKRLKNPVRRCRKNAENSPFAPGRETQNNSRPSCSKGG